MISDSEIRCIDEYSQGTRTYTVPKFYVVDSRRQAKLRVRNRREEIRTVFSSTPDPISLRSECGLCQVYSRSGSDSMHGRKSHDGVRIGGVHTPSDELIDGYPICCHHKEVLRR